MEGLISSLGTLLGLQSIRIAPFQEGFDSYVIVKVFIAIAAIEELALKIKTTITMEAVKSSDSFSREQVTVAATVATTATTSSFECS